MVHSKVHHFADEANFLYASHSLKKIIKSINLNQTEQVIFRSPKKQIYKNLNFRLSGQKIEPKHHKKYLVVILDEYLSFNEYLNTLKQKLNRANDILAKL